MSNNHAIKKLNKIPSNESRRTYMIHIDWPKNGYAFVQGFRESVYIDDRNVDVGITNKDILPISIVLDVAGIARVPDQFKTLPTLLESFFDWLEDANS